MIDLGVYNVRIPSSGHTFLQQLIFNVTFTVGLLFSQVVPVFFCCLEAFSPRRKLPQALLSFGFQFCGIPVLINNPVKNHCSLDLPNTIFEPLRLFIGCGL